MLQMYTNCYPTAHPLQVLTVDTLHLTHTYCIACVATYVVASMSERLCGLVWMRM